MRYLPLGLTALSRIRAFRPASPVGLRSPCLTAGVRRPAVELFAAARTNDAAAATAPRPPYDAEALAERARDFLRRKNAAGSGNDTLEPLFDMCSPDADFYGLAGEAEYRPGLTDFFAAHPGLQHELIEEPTAVGPSAVQYPFVKSWRNVDGGDPQRWSSIDPEKPRDRVERLDFDEAGLLARVAVIDRTASLEPLGPRVEAASLGGSLYAVNARFCIRPERRKEFLEIIGEDRERTLSTEAGALQFVVGEDVSTGNTFYLHEQYDSVEAFRRHCETAHFAVWNTFAKSNPWSEDGEPVVGFYHGTHDPVRELTWRSAYCVNARFSILPEKREDFLAVMEEDREQTLSTEEGALQFIVGEDAEIANTFFLHEQYEDEEAFKHHCETPHFAVWDQFTKTDPWTEGGEPVAGFYRTFE